MKMTGRIVIISGACGTGKTTVARRLAEGTPADRAVHLHTDDFYQYIRKGYIAPWMDGSGDQNDTVIRAAAASAGVFAADGYDVYVDGFIGPWYLSPWVALARGGADVRYVVLRPDRETTVRRAMARAKRVEFPLEEATVDELWEAMEDLGAYEGNAVDTTGQSVEESVGMVERLLAEGVFALGAR